MGPDMLIDSGARLLTPPLRALYAVLVRIGVLHIVE